MHGRVQPGRLDGSGPDRSRGIELPHDESRSITGAAQPKCWAALLHLTDSLGQVGPSAKSGPPMTDTDTSEITPQLFRKGMSRFATGVTVITTELNGEARGMTASAFMSGSLHPPL